MAIFLLLAPLLLLGMGMAQAQTETEGCQGLWNATEGTFSVKTTPDTYWANTTYVVTIQDDGNHSSTPEQYLLQALSPQNESVGEWGGLSTWNCSSVDTALLNITQNATEWTSPDTNLSSVQFRVYLTFPGDATQLKTFTLNREAGPSPSPSGSPSSAPAVRSSSLVLAALQLPPLLLAAKLLS